MGAKRIACGASGLGDAPRPSSSPRASSTPPVTSIIAPVSSPRRLGPQTTPSAPKSLIRRAIPRRYRAGAKRLYYRTLRQRGRQAIIARKLEWHAGGCRELGSPLYARLLKRTAADVREGGLCWGILQGHEMSPVGMVGALPLRFMASVHRIVLEGRAPGLAAHYPSAGGVAGDSDPWPVFVATLEEHRDELRAMLELPEQTNEVGRSAALLGGFMIAAGAARLPIRQFEPGASAGLNLRWDRYRYETRDAGWGDPDSPVRLSDAFVDRVPRLDSDVRVVDRAGCDAAPLDPRSPDDRLTLTSFIWADQPERIERLKGAMDVAARVPAAVERADAVEWTAAQLGRLHPGAVTILFHSFFVRFLEPDERDRLASVIAEAGRGASDRAPLAWLRMEGGLFRAEVRMTMWPGGRERLLAISDAYGRRIRWLDQR